MKNKILCLFMASMMLVYSEASERTARLLTIAVQHELSRRNIQLLRFCWWQWPERKDFLPFFLFLLQYLPFGKSWFLHT